MAKTTPFQAYNLERKKRAPIPNSAVKLHQSRLDRGEWAEAAKSKAAPASKPAKVGKKRGRFSKKSRTVRLPHRATDVLSCAGDGEFACLHCGKLADDPNCGLKCYRAFKKQHFIAKQVEIRGPGPLGYGAFTKPGAHIKKGQYLDEYIGDLRPLESDDNGDISFYRLEIPRVCAIDAEKAGNWTRFINSHCQPNVKPYGDTIGKRHVVLFEALRDIGPEEELVFYYGRQYFEKAGFECVCSAHKAPHIPGQKPSAKKTRSR